MLLNRAERRRAEKDCLSQISVGIDANTASFEIIVALTRSFRKKITVSQKVRSVDPLFNFVFSAMDKSLVRSQDVGVACTIGCDHCCYTWVAAIPGESIFFAKHYPESLRKVLIERTREEMKHVKGLSFDERGALSRPCPAFNASRCSNYSGRPNVCRTAASVDEKSCRRAYRQFSGENIPMPRAMTVGSAAFLALRS